MSAWPLVYVGQARALHAEALDTIAERSGIPRSEMLDPANILDEPCYRLAEEARPLEEVGTVLFRRRAWSEVIDLLGGHLEPLWRR